MFPGETELGHVPWRGVFTCGDGSVQGGSLPSVHLFPGEAIGPQCHTVVTAAVRVLKRAAAWRSHTHTHREKVTYVNMIKPDCHIIISSPV